MGGTMAYIQPFMYNTLMYKAGTVIFAARLVLTGFKGLSYFNVKKWLVARLIKLRMQLSLGFLKLV